MDKLAKPVHIRYKLIQEILVSLSIARHYAMLIRVIAFISMHFKLYPLPELLIRGKYGHLHMEQGHPNDSGSNNRCSNILQITAALSDLIMRYSNAVYKFISFLVTSNRRTCLKLINQSEALSQFVP